MREAFQQWTADGKRLYQASKSATLSLFLIAIFVSILPTATLVSFGHFVDSIIGARGLHIWTSDLSKYGWQTLVCGIGLAAGLSIITRASGLMRSFISRLMTVIFLIVTGLAAIPAGPIQVIVIVFLFIMIRTRQEWWAPFVALSLSIVLLSHAIYSLLYSSVIHDATTGQFLAWSGLLVLFVVGLNVMQLNESRKVER